MFQRGCLCSLIWSPIKKKILWLKVTIQFLHVSMATSCCFYSWTKRRRVCLLHLMLTFKNSRRCYLPFSHSCSPHRSRCCSIMSRCLITWPWSDYGCLTGLARYATATVNWCQQFSYVLPHAIRCGVAAFLHLYSVHVGQYYNIIYGTFFFPKYNKTNFHFVFFPSLQAQPLVLHYTIKDKRSR